ncbi:MAG: membrane protein insertase YidC [Alphaproteobacteria bacterium]|nr:membrane protein insertase YidC [Alphaproteobacteria bacterium]
MVQYLNNNSGFNQWNSMRQQQNTTGNKKLGLFWWILLFLFAWLALGSWFQPKKQADVVTNVAPVEKVTKVSVKKISSDKISLNVQGLRFSNIKLLDYQQSPKENTPVELLGLEDNFIEVGFVSKETSTPTINTSWKGNKDTFVWNNNAGVSFSRSIIIKDYVINIADTITNKSGKDISVSPYARIVQNGSVKMSGAIETGAVVFANSKLDYTNWPKLDKKPYAYSTVNGSFGCAEQYWDTIASIDAIDQTLSMKKQGELYFADASAAPVKIANGSKSVINTYVYTGPRMSETLSASSDNIPGLYKTVDYGWFWFLAQPMLWMINQLNTFVGNYGIAIILMTLILRLLIWPLTRKSYASTMAMQKMQPELQRVQKLYANDKMRLQAEMMKIYQEHKTSPMSGCLPMLIQIPIFFALYKALLISVSMRSAHFLWISDLSIMDPYFILPILMGATMWIQQYMQSAKQSKSSDNKNDVMASTQRAMKWMPIIFTVMFAWMPAGLVLYWTVSNLFGLLQMYIIKKTVK